MPFLTPRDATRDPAVTTVEVQRLGKRRLERGEQLSPRALLAVHAGDLGNPADPPLTILLGYRRVGVGHPLTLQTLYPSGHRRAILGYSNRPRGNALLSSTMSACSARLTESALSPCPCRLNIGCWICSVATADARHLPQRASRLHTITHDALRRMRNACTAPDLVVRRLVPSAPELQSASVRMSKASPQLTALEALQQRRTTSRGTNHAHCPEAGLHRPCA